MVATAAAAPCERTLRHWRRHEDISLQMRAIYVSEHSAGINAYYTAGRSRTTQLYAPLEENLLGYLSTRMNPSLSL